MWFASTVNAVWEQHFHWRAAVRLLGPYAAVLLSVILFGVLRLNWTVSSPQGAQAATITIDQAVSDRANSGINWATFNQSTDAQRAAARPRFQATVDQMLMRTQTAMQRGAKVAGWQEGSALVRATGNGPSLITDPQGRTPASRDYFVKNNNGIMMARVPTHGVTTIYDDIGHLFAYACVLGLAILAGWAFLQRRPAAADAHRRTAANGSHGEAGGSEARL
jgi:hypothetical protein